MKRKRCMAGFIVFLAFAASSCQAQESRYRMRIMNDSGVTLIECIFSGNDSNGDGVIVAAELAEFTENENREWKQYSRTAAWGQYVDLSSMPVLVHTMDDIVKFSFNEKEFANGQTILEYHTVSHEDLIHKSYHFWRIVKVSCEDENISLSHGIGDGTRGLSLSMTDPASLVFSIEKLPSSGIPGGKS